jgi:hypothetical protein
VIFVSRKTDHDVYKKLSEPLFDLNSVVVEKGNDLLINRYSFDVLSGHFHNRRIAIRNGVRKDKPYSIRMYNATEIIALLDKVGIIDYSLLGEDIQPVSARSRRIVVIARKTIGI